MNEVLEHRPMQRREDSTSSFEIWKDEYGVHHAKIVNETRSLADYFQDWLDARKAIRGY